MKFLLAISLIATLATNALASGRSDDAKAEANNPSSADLELLESAYAGDKNGVLLALQKGANIHAKVSMDYVKNPEYDGLLDIHVADETALAIAVKEQFAGIVKILLEHGANTEDKTSWGDRLLGKAVRWNNLRIAKLLLQHGADANAGRGFLPLGRAMSNDNVEMLTLLLEHGANPNASGDLESPPLHEAAFLGGLDRVPSIFSSKHAKMMSLLIQYKADPNLKTKSGETPLMATADLAFKQGAEVLLRHGVRIDATDNKGNTALIIAAGEEDGLGVVKLLLKAQANVNATNTSGNSALHAAVKNEKSEGIVQALLKAKADVNAVNNDGNSALHLAADNGLNPSPKAVEYLLKYGADYNAVNKSGETPLQLAILWLKSAKKHGGHDDDIKQYAAIVRMLRKASE